MAKILVVDDILANREFLVTLLGYRGHRLLEAADGAQALELARSEHPDLVVTDILMPTMDGFEFVRQLRADPGTARVPVIFYTATYHEREAVALAQACGVTRLLPKPCEPAEALHIIEETLASASRDPDYMPPQDIDRRHLQLLTDKLSRTAGELEFANARLAALIEVNLQLASERDPRRLLEGVCAAARRLIASRYAVVYAVDREGRRAEAFSCGMDERTAALVMEELAQAVPARVLAAGARLVRTGGLDRGARPGVLPASHPPINSLVVAPLRSPESQYGWICLSGKVGTPGFTDDDGRLLEILASQVGRIHANASLHAALQRRTARLEEEIARREGAEQRQRDLSRRLIDVEERARRSINRELHDRIGQNLAALNLNLGIVRSRLPDASLRSVGARMDDMQMLIEGTSRQVRDLMAELRPAALDDYGLFAALRAYAGPLTARINIPISVEGAECEPRLPQPREVALFRIAQEALNNAAKHARARQLVISLTAGPDRARLVVADDGAGFDAETITPSRLNWGIRTMRERAEAVGVDFRIESAPGKGTRVVVEAPLNPPYPPLTKGGASEASRGI